MILPLNENFNNRVVWGQMKEKPWAEHLVPVYVILDVIRIEIKLLLKIRTRVNVIWIKGLTLNHLTTGHSPSPAYTLYARLQGRSTIVPMLLPSASLHLI